MPGGYDYDVPSGDPAPEPPERFARSLLDPAGQKIYDQLKAQRAYLEQSMGPEQAAKYYTTIGGLSPDASIAMMAAELRDTGITDIYKVKKDTVTDRLPIQYGVIQEGGEGSDVYGWFYDDPVKGRVGVNPNDPNQVKDFKKETYAWDPYALTTDGEGGASYGAVVSTPGSGFVEVPRTQYINTETNQPLVSSVGVREWGERPDLLSDMGIAKRQIAGTGVKFLDDGTPFYFSEGLNVPSGGFFRSGIGSTLLGLGASFLLGPQMAGLSKIAAASIGGGLSGLARSDGDLKEALKGAALSGLTSYGLDALAGSGGFNVPSPSDFIAMEGVGYDALANSLSGVDPFLGDPTAAFGGMGPIAPPSLGYNPNIPPGEAGIQQILSEAAGASPNYIDDLFSGAGAPTPDVAFPELFAPPGAGYDLGYALNEVNQPFTPEPTLDPTLGDPTAAPGGMPTEAAPQPEFDITDVVPPDADPTLGDPTAAPGGMPKLSVGDQLAIAGMTAGGSLAAFAATPAGRLALAIGGPMLLEKVFGDKQAGGAGAGPTGWSGTIPEYQMVRERVPLADAGRRPGEYGRRYFSDTSFVPLTPGAENAEANLGLIQQAQQAAQAQAAGLASLPPGVAERRAAPTPAAIYQNPLEPVRAAQGGLMGLAKGRYLDGPTDGMEDKLKTTIEGEQPARLSHGEFVIPADVVSHLGNGNSQAGAKRLYDMMDKIRHARTGSKKQGRQINPDKYLPS